MTQAQFEEKFGEIKISEGNWIMERALKSKDKRMMDGTLYNIGYYPQQVNLPENDWAELAKDLEMLQFLKKKLDDAGLYYSDFSDCEYYPLLLTTKIRTSNNKKPLDSDLLKALDIKTDDFEIPGFPRVTEYFGFFSSLVTYEQELADMSPQEIEEEYGVTQNQVQAAREVIEIMDTKLQNAVQVAILAGYDHFPVIRIAQAHSGNWLGFLIYVSDRYFMADLENDEE